ncbi:hypothetical protein ACG7TL_006948 [Trametes sanguinea]
MSQASFDSHWDLVLGIYRDKRWFKYPLLTSDLYWLMRARIARFEEHIESSNDNAIKVWLPAAKRCYDNIRNSSFHPDVHAPYLKALLITSLPEHIHEFIMHVTAIFARSQGLHQSIRDVLFKSILSAQDGPYPSRADLLATIAERFADDRAGENSFHNGQPARGREDFDRDLPHSLPVNARGLVTALERAVFHDKWMRTPRDAVAAQVHAWSSAVARRVFSVASDDKALTDLRWNCLVLLALIRTTSSQWRGHSADAVREPLRRAAGMEWQTVCVLAAIENVLGETHAQACDSLAPEVVQGFSGVLRKLWHDWTSIPVSDGPPRPPYVSRIVCASFLKLAGYLKDKSLVDACREYCVSAGLWLYQESNPSSAAGLPALAVEQLHAALMSGTFFERALVDLVVCTTDMDILRKAVDSAILRQARLDPEQAQELVAWASHRGIAPSSRVIAHVGVGLARCGDSSYLERYMAHPRLNPEERAHVLVAHLRMYASHGRQFMSPTAFMNAAHDAMLLSTQVADPKVLCRAFWSSLLVLVKEGYGARAVSLAKDLTARHSSAFPTSNYTKLLLALLRNREVKAAHALLAHCSALHPDMASAWKAIVFSQSVRDGASRLASTLARSSGIGRSLRWQAVSLSRSLRDPKRTLFASFRLSQLYGQAPNPVLASRAVQLLIRLGRFHAAKKLYERICGQESPEVRTSTGNMILHGAAQRPARSRLLPVQRVRTVLYLYKTLREKYAFAPDRVSINILLKTMLLSKQLNATQMRGLFDALVGMGYPSGVRSAEGGVTTSAGVFGTSAVERLVIGGLEIPSFPAPMMYMRHVRPLYKTFIKAFYVLGDVQAARTIVGILKALEAGKVARLARGRDWDVHGRR